MLFGTYNLFFLVVFEKLLLIASLLSIASYCKFIDNRKKAVAVLIVMFSVHNIEVYHVMNKDV